MATTTTNFGWDIPQSTDLVKDGATAIAALGQDIDTALIDLKGGTTGQVLAKASATDLDFSWVAQDDSNAIQNAIVDAKGDLIGATASDTPARLAVGTNGQVLTADSTAATGLKWASATSGGMTLLETVTLSGASVTTASIPGTYKELRLYVRNFKPGDTNVGLVMRMNADANTRYISISQFANVAAQAPNATGMRFTAGQSNSADSISQIDIIIPDYANAVTGKMSYGYGMTQDQTTSTSFNMRGYMNWYNQTAAITSLTFLPETGNLTSGSVLVYGVS
jgi:hypothetical protein